MIIPQLHAALGPLFRDAGLPENVLQILNFSEEDVAQRMLQMISHRDVAVSDVWRHLFWSETWTECR